MSIRSIVLKLAVGALAFAVLPLPAQWPQVKTRRVPLAADGKPNLAAAAPKTADGKTPDFSGVWNSIKVPCEGSPAGADFGCSDVPFGVPIGLFDVTANGDVLVVETVGYKDGLWLDLKGDPLTSTGHTIERIRRPNYGNLVVEVTVDDPKVYTRPWKATRYLKIALNSELIEDICNENEKSLVHMVGK